MYCRELIDMVNQVRDSLLVEDLSWQFSVWDAEKPRLHKILSLDIQPCIPCFDIKQKSVIAETLELYTFALSTHHPRYTA
jgi:hypothetical protein